MIDREKREAARVLNIRSATDSDMATGRFVEITGRAMGHPEKATEFIAQARARGSSILVACSDRGIVGTIISEARDDRFIEIINVATAHDTERRGVGSALVLALLARSKGCPVCAETDVEAVGFYRSLGFTIESLGDKYPGTVRYRCVSMEPRDNSKELRPT